MTCLVRAESDGRRPRAARHDPRQLIANGAELFDASRRGGRRRADGARTSAVGAATRDRLAAEVTTIVHCAASVSSFDQTLEEARAINVERHAADARVRDARPAARRPASATPRSRPRTSPAPTPGASPRTTSTSARSFRNTYEQSKFESETAGPRRGRGSALDGPAPEHRRRRPSRAAGRRRSTSCTGRCGRSRRGSSGRCRRCPSRRSTSSRSTTSPTRSTSFASARGLAAHETFHLTAERGRLDAWPRSSSLACTLLPQPEPQAVPPAEFVAGPARSRTPRSSPAASTSRTSRWRPCSTTPARARGSRRPGSSARRCASTCTGCSTSRLRSRWGKRPIARAEALARRALLG